MWLVSGENGGVWVCHSSHSRGLDGALPLLSVLPKQSTVKRTHLHSTLITPMQPFAIAPLFSLRTRELYRAYCIKRLKIRAGGFGWTLSEKWMRIWKAEDFEQRVSVASGCVGLLVWVNCVSELSETERPTVCGRKWHFGIFVCSFSHLFIYLSFFKKFVLFLFFFLSHKLQSNSVQNSARQLKEHAHSSPCAKYVTLITSLWIHPPPSLPPLCFSVSLFPLCFLSRMTDALCHVFFSPLKSEECLHS